MVFSLLQADMKAIQLKMEKMEDELKCKVCMDAGIATAFAPCFYVCCCQAGAHNPSRRTKFSCISIVSDIIELVQQSGKHFCWVDRN